jgi:tRNA U34 5-methylaminomethyl-2-thiouridine-forming methyltransferase MnmC
MILVGAMVTSCPTFTAAIPARDVIQRIKLTAINLKGSFPHRDMTRQSFEDSNVDTHINSWGCVDIKRAGM